MASFSKPQSMIAMLAVLFALLQFTVAFSHSHYSHEHARRHADAAIHAQIDQVNDALVKRAGYVAVTGVCNSGTGQNGACNSNGRQSAPRLEIRELAKNQDQWNLYLLGMERFQAKDKNDVLSYYQIAGIHGRPFTTWNNFPTPLKNQAGFCPHGMTLFGSWHRPYLAVYEQGLYKAVLEVISGFPANQQQRLKNIASTLRIPYWDWAVGPGQDGRAVPSLITNPKVTVNKPQGQVEIDNPLYSYKFGDSLPDEMGGGPQNNLPYTVRRPITDASPIRSNDDELNDRFNSQWISLRDRVFSLFASKQSWGYASTSAIGVQTDLQDNDSFESIHDAVHNTAGGETGGHMYFLDVSSFDPIFWLHHTNVDRLLTMYQYIVPDTYVANGAINGPMAQWNAGEQKNGNTPLKPFVKDTQGNYYSSNDVKETRTLGYHYPETSDRSADQVSKAVNDLYGAGKSLQKRADKDSKTGQYLGRPFKEGEYHTVMQIIANKHALIGSYTVHCFVGKPNNTASGPYTNGTQYSNSTNTDYTKQPNYVGSYGILGGMRAGNGNATHPLMTTGTLPLSTCLQGKEKYGDLKSLTPEHITPYLKDNLYYKVVGLKGEIDPTTIPNFHVSVKCTKVTLPKKPDQLPDFSAPYKPLPEITKDKPAGQPYVYTPPPQPTYPTNPPELEPGYCPVKQVVHYVDDQGKFLYASM